MSDDKISGLSLRDRSYNSFFQDNIKQIDANGVGSPALGQVVGGLVTSGTLTYANYDGVPFSFGTDGRLRAQANIGSTAGVYMVACGVSGTSVIPLAVTGSGYLMTASGTY